MWFPFTSARGIQKYNSIQYNGACCVFKFFPLSLNRKHSMRFQSEKSGFCSRSFWTYESGHLMEWKVKITTGNKEETIHWNSKYKTTWRQNVKIQTDCDMGFWKTVRLHSRETYLFIMRALFTHDAVCLNSIYCYNSHTDIRLYLPLNHEGNYVRVYSGIGMNRRLAARK